MTHIVFGIDPTPHFNQQNLEIALQMKGVYGVQADPLSHLVTVDFDPVLLTPEDLQWAIQGIGFRPF
jgi:monoamine oxidase